jgi:signal transduction histidine kinase
VTVRWRLLLTVGGIIFLMALPSFYGIVQLQRLRDLAEGLESIHAGDVLALGNLRASLSELDRLQRSYVAAPDESFRSGMQSQIGLARTYLVLLDRSNYSAEVARPRVLVDSLAGATARLETLVEAGRHEEATDYFDAVKPVLDEARMSLEPVASALDERGRAARAEARRVSAAAAQTTMLAVVLALLLTVALGLWTTGALSRPLSRLRAATARVADGEFQAPADLPYDRDDEIGDLSRAFGAMTERLAELDRLKAEFVSLATHELKTPINVIGGYAELLEEGLYGELEEKQRQVISTDPGADALADAGWSTSSWTSPVSRPAGSPSRPGRWTWPRCWTRWRARSGRWPTRSRSSSRWKSTHRRPSGRSWTRTGSATRCSATFSPTRSSSHLRRRPDPVRAWGADDQVHLEVSDTGVGIPEDQIAHVFDKYYQVGAEAKAMGSGLGLAIVKHVVDAHGGSIEATSQPGKGTRFHIQLPQGARTA